MFVFGKTEKKKVIAVLDIASASVGGMLVEQSGKSLLSHNNLAGEVGPIKVISAIRKPVNFLSDIDFEASRRCTIDALKKTIKKLLKDFPSGPNAVLCVFSSPWYVSEVKTLNIRKEKTFEIKRNFFNQLFKDEEESFKKAHPFLGPLQKNEMELIERENIKTEINGYLTEYPIGKKAKTVRADFYFSLGVRRVTDEIKKEVLKNFGDIPLLFRTLPFLTFFILNKVVRVKENFLVVDVGGEMTDIYLIKNNTLSRVVSFPCGVNFLIRNIAVKLGTFIDEAASILKIFLKRHRSPERSEKVAAAVKQAKEEWGLLFDKTIADLAKDTPLPQSIFLLGNKIDVRLFVDDMQNDRLAKFTILGKPLKMINVKPDWLLHYFDFNSVAAAASLEKGFIADQGKDVILLLESLFANEAF